MDFVALFTVFILSILHLSFNCFIARLLNQSVAKIFFISFVLTPVVGLIVLLISGTKGKKCPKCAETIKNEALKCKHCGHEFVDDLEADKIKKIEQESSKLKF